MFSKAHRWSPKEEDELRESGIPPRGELGASKQELMALGLGLLVMMVLGLAFWYQATH